MHKLLERDLENAAFWSSAAKVFKATAWSGENGSEISRSRAKELIERGEFILRHKATGRETNCLIVAPRPEYEDIPEYALPDQIEYLTTEYLKTYSKVVDALPEPLKTQLRYYRDE